MIVIPPLRSWENVAFFTFECEATLASLLLRLQQCSNKCYRFTAKEAVTRYNNEVLKGGDKIFQVLKMSES